MDVFDTYTLIAAIEKIPIEPTFLRDRYFPTNTATDVFESGKVLIDWRERTNKIAQFVMPRIAPVPVSREGFSTYEMEPPNIALSIPLHIDQLYGRGFGEALNSQHTPEQRAATMQAEDMVTLSNMITRLENLMAAKTMIGNGCTMRHISDKKDVFMDVEAKFYDGDNNPAAFTPATPWTHSSKTGESWVIGNWYDDITAMINHQHDEGNDVTEILVSSDVARFIQSDGWFRDTLDNHSMNYGLIEPRKNEHGVTSYGRVDFGGNIVEMIEYYESYTDETDGSRKPFLPEGTVICAAPYTGRGLYGAVTIVENREFRTVAGRRVPQRIVTESPAMISTAMYSKPLFVPKTPNPWYVASNVFGV